MSVAQGSLLMSREKNQGSKPLTSLVWTFFLNDNILEPPCAKGSLSWFEASYKNTMSGVSGLYFTHLYLMSFNISFKVVSNWKLKRILVLQAWYSYGSIGISWCLNFNKNRNVVGLLNRPVWLQSTSARCWLKPYGTVQASFAKGSLMKVQYPKLAYGPSIYPS